MRFVIPFMNSRTAQEYREASAGRRIIPNARAQGFHYKWYYILILYRFVHGVKKKPQLLSIFKAFFSMHSPWASCGRPANRL